MNPQFPVYIPSKGRYDSRLTVKALQKMGVPFYVVVEEQELEKYAEHIDRKQLLVLDRAFQRNYETFDDFGDSKVYGGGPARNFAWEHAISIGAKWHWVMDDNIRNFVRLNQNRKIPVGDGTILRCMEDFCLRYINVGMAGPHYDFFIPRKRKFPPYFQNCRIYSCNLIRNDLPFRWRGRMNEDTDLSLQILKAGWCTIQFVAFLQKKATTQTVKGGNTEQYRQDGTMFKSRWLVERHPDVAKVVWKYGRWHHYVDYSPYKNIRLIRKPGVKIAEDVNNYGMELYLTERQSANSVSNKQENVAQHA